MAQTLKNLPAMLETWVPSLGGEDSLEEDSVLSLPRVWIQSLIGELRSYKLCGMTQPKHTHTHTHRLGSQNSYTVGQHINYVDLFGEQLVKKYF